MTHSSFMLDTTVFNQVREKGFDFHIFDGRQIFVLHVQLDELDNTPDPDRKAELVGRLISIAPASLVAETGVWGTSPWKGFKWSRTSEHSLYSKLLRCVREGDRRDRFEKQSRDARIGEAAIIAGLTLVTNDRILSAAVLKHGGKVMTLEEFSALPSLDSTDVG
jgi:hypothetical protein